MVPTIQRH